MALHKTEVQKAWYLFRDILSAANMSTNSFILEFDKKRHQTTTGIVFGAGQKSDDGWENVFIQLDYFTPKQRRIWEDGKKNIPNSPFANEPNAERGVWQIGFF